MNIRQSALRKNKRARLVNSRPLFYGFLAFGLGIALAYFLFSLNLTFLILLAAAGSVLFGCLIWRRQFINLLLVVVCFGAGIGAYFLECSKFSHAEYAGNNYSVVGRVTTKIYDKADYVFVVLQDVKFDGSAAPNIALSIQKYGSGFAAEAGMLLGFDAEVYSEFLFENGTFNSFAYKNQTSLCAYVDAVDINVLSTGNLNFAETVRLQARDIIQAWMPFQTAELAYSILFGDQTLLDEDIKKNFATSGLGHLVAVSGLNTAVLVASLYFLLKLFRTPKVAKFCIVAVILLFYCYLCSFAPSVVRASLMAIVFLASGLLARQYDLLSSLGVAGLIILLFSPFAVFDAGFLMSFMCVVAIGMLAKPVANFYQNRCRFPKALADALAIDICTTLAIAPILATYFSQISFLSWLANLVCVPLFSLAYIIIFFVVVIASIIPFVGALLYVPHLILALIIWFAGCIASVEGLIINIYSLSVVGVVAFYLCLFFSGKMFMSNLTKRLTAISICVVSAVVLLPVTTMPALPKTASFTALNSYSPASVFTSKSGEVLVVGGGELAQVEEYLMFKNIRNVTALVITENANLATPFVQKYNPKYVVEDNMCLTSYGDFAVEFLHLNGLTKGVYVKIEDFGVVFATSHIGDVQAVSLKSKLLSYDVDALYENTEKKNFYATSNYEYVFSAEQVAGISAKNIATKMRGAFTFAVSGDIMGEIRSVN